MKSGFDPDDWWLENEGQDGIDKVKTALKNHKHTFDKILHSRLPEIDQARHELKVEGLPEGWQSWVLPAYLDHETPVKPARRGQKATTRRSKATFFVLQVARPGAVLPTHQHKVPQLRIVLSGGLLYNGTELRCGDWLYTPADAKYSLSVATNPGEHCLMLYCY